MPPSSSGWNDCSYEINITHPSDSCKEYLEIYGSEVLLSADLTWSDDICDELVWIVQFEGKMDIYKDIEFSEEQGISYPFSWFYHTQIIIIH